MDAATAFALGAVVVGAAAAPVVFRQWRRNARLLEGSRRAEAEARAAWDTVAASPDGFLVWDATSGTVRASRRLAVLLDLPKGTDSGYDDLRARFAAEDAADLDAGVTQLRRDGTPFSLILPVAGNHRRVRIHGVRAYRADGEPTADVLWVRDAGTAAEAVPMPEATDEPKTAEPEIEAPAKPSTGPDALPAGSGFRVLETLPLAIAIYDADTRLAFHNAAFARLWRFDAAALAGRPRLGRILDWLREHRRLPEVPDYAAFRDEQVALFGALHEPQTTLMHRPDGTTVRRVVAPHPGGGLVFVFEDLSERLSLERSLNELNAVQRETLDNLFEAVAVFGGDGRLKLSNPAFAGLWGMDDIKVEAGLHVGEFLERVQNRLIEDRAGTETFMTAARFMARQPAGGRLPRTDGTVLEFATVPLPDGAQLVSFLDVTDSDRVERALRQRAEALDAANRLKSEFIANVSYEIRTPLTTLTGFAEILTEEYFGKLNRRQMEYSQGILETSRTLMSVVADILDLASIEAGMMALELDTVDVHSMLAGTLKLIRERARHKTLEVTFDCSPDIGWMVGDEKRLRQVFFNLMSNAVRFTPRRGRIGLSAHRNGAEVIVEVSDSGPGMDAAEAKRAVEPFVAGVRADTDAPGAGLGLTLVSRFVELHGGHLDIRSSRGRGTKVTCRLPTGEAAAAADPDDTDDEEPDMDLETGSASG